MDSISVMARARTVRSPASTPSTKACSVRPPGEMPAEPVFTPERKAQLEALAARYPNRQALLLPALWMAQRAHGWITPEAVVRDVMMGFSRVKEMMSPIEVGNLFLFGFSRFAKYLIGGDLLFDGGVVKTYAKKKC